MYTFEVESVPNKLCFFILENHFQESRCIKQIYTLQECCNKYHTISLVCSGMKPSPTTKQNQDIQVIKY